MRGYNKSLENIFWFLNWMTIVNEKVLCNLEAAANLFPVREKERILTRRLRWELNYVWQRKKWIQHRRNIHTVAPWALLVMILGILPAESPEWVANRKQRSALATGTRWRRRGSRAQRAEARAGIPITVDENPLIRAFLLVRTLN